LMADCANASHRIVDCNSRVATRRKPFGAHRSTRTRERKGDTLFYFEC